MLLIVVLKIVEAFDFAICVEKIARKNREALVNGRSQTDGSDGVARRWLNEERMSAPFEVFIIMQQMRDRHILGEGKELVSNLIEVEDAPVGPEAFDVFKEVALVCRYRDGNATSVGKQIALRLVAMIVRVKNVINAGNAEFIQEIENPAGTEVDEQATITISNEVDVAGISEYKELLRDPDRALCCSE